MNSSILAGLAWVMLQTWAYLSCLSWLAWRGYRRQGIDAFHLVVAFAFAVWCISFLTDMFEWSPLLSILVASSAGFVIDEAWLILRKTTTNELALVLVIVVATLALVTFDWATSHTPVNLPVGSAYIKTIAVICALVAWILIMVIRQTRTGKVLRLGRRNIWSMEYWARPFSLPLTRIMIAGILCWVSVLSIPVATTGLLSTTILRDVAIAILIARLAGSRGVTIVLAACMTLAFLRPLVGFIFVSPLGPPLVEATIFLCLLLWLRFRSSRTAWGDAYVR